MIRTTILIALMLGLPLGAAMAQTAAPTCGPETWSTDKMAYVAQPCANGTVGAAGPTVYGSNSTTMTKAEMKGGIGPYAPAPIQAAAPGPYASNGDCGPANVVAITDEYHHKYNCRGDRIR